MALSRPANPFEAMPVNLLKRIAKLMKLLELRKILDTSPNKAFNDLPDDIKLERTFCLVRQSHQDALGIRLRWVSSTRSTEVRVIFTGQGQNNLFKCGRDIPVEVFDDADNWVSQPGIVIFSPDHKTAEVYADYLKPFYDVFLSKGFPASSFLKMIGQGISDPIFVTSRSDGEWREFPRVTVSLGPPRSVEELVKILKIGSPYHLILCPQEKTACEQLVPILEYLESNHVHPSLVNDPNCKQICPAGKQ